MLCHLPVKVSKKLICHGVLFLLECHNRRDSTVIVGVHMAEKAVYSDK